jgi:hypothetical protein
VTSGNLVAAVSDVALEECINATPEYLQHDFIVAENFCHLYKKGISTFCRIAAYFFILSSNPIL